MYGDVLRVNDTIQKRIKERKLFSPNSINAIVFATYYRLVGEKLEIEIIMTQDTSP